jgi:hypothetical protein
MHNGFVSSLRLSGALYNNATMHSFTDTCRVLRSGMEDEYGALLRHVYKFWWRVAAVSGKSADPILHCEPPLLKHFSEVMGDFKN